VSPQDPDLPQSPSHRAGFVSHGSTAQIEHRADLQRPWHLKFQTETMKDVSKVISITFNNIVIHIK
jgi:hypothetical protein